MDPLNTSSHTNALTNPRNRQLLIIIGVVILSLLTALAIWQSSGTHGAKRDVAAANDKVMDKQKEVADAQRVLDQKIVELRALRADADVQATKLGSVVDRQIDGTVNNARVDLPVNAAVLPAGGDVDDAQYYVRDRKGRFVPINRR